MHTSRRHVNGMEDLLLDRVIAVVVREAFVLEPRYFRLTTASASSSLARYE